MKIILSIPSEILTKEINSKTFCVYIISVKYILLRSRDIDLEYFSTDMLSSKKNNFYNKFDFNDEKFIEDSLNTMDTAFSGYFFYLS